uniref:Ground-like domain-containing protein n=1 Tax=Elaeophora elaphi TaxID=1147741 RepID=A0A0R3RYN5_9BILA
MEFLILTIIFTQIWNVCDTFGCCPVVVPCIPIRCRPCIRHPCPPILSPPPPPPPPPPPAPPTCPPPLPPSPCLPPPICPLPPPPVICPTLPPPCPPPIICPPPPPPITCPPLPPPCPPPPICPTPIICPPPVICPPPPPPLPPPPPPPCPPPPPAPICPFPEVAPQPTYTTPVINDCCCTCTTPCVYSQMRIHGAKIFSASLDTDLEHDSKCNNPVLKSIMEEKMSSDTTASKRAIQRTAEEKLFKKFNVICSENDFSYIAYTDTFCQHTNYNITCYAFSPLPEN